MELDFLQKAFLWIKDRLCWDILIFNYKPIILVLISFFVAGFFFDKFITNKILNFLAYLGYFLFGQYILFLFIFNVSSPKYIIFPEKLREIWRTSIYDINKDKYDSNAVILDCKNIKQEKDLCTTASAEIVLKYYKDNSYDQKQIKALVENKIYNKDKFDLHYSTCYKKLVDGMSKINYDWRLESISNKNKYINTIESEINNQRPVIVSALWDTHHKLRFAIITHSVVIYGYDSDNFYILEPTLNENNYVKINKKLFEKIRLSYIVLTKEKHPLQKYFIIDPINKPCPHK